MNVNQQTFRSNAPNPVSLKQITGNNVDSAVLLENILNRFQSYYRQLQSGDYQSLHTAYMQRLYRREGVHPFEDSEGSFCASIENISPLGMLTLQREDGSQRTYAFKEVRFVVPSSKER